MNFEISRRVSNYKAESLVYNYCEAKNERNREIDALET
jgi:hypothetical protein